MIFLKLKKKFFSKKTSIFYDFFLNLKKNIFSKNAKFLIILNN